MLFKKIRMVDGLAMGLLAGALLFSWGLAWWWHWVPCLLCLLQRLFFLVMLFFMGVLMFVTNVSWVQRMASCGYFFVLALGLFFAGYHVYLQYIPARQASCLPDWRVMWDYMSWSQIMHIVAQGDGHCRAAAMHRWLFSLPVWVVLFYLLLIVLHVGDALHSRLALLASDKT